MKEQENYCNKCSCRECTYANLIIELCELIGQWNRDNDNLDLLAVQWAFTRMSKLVKEIREEV